MSLLVDYINANEDAFGFNIRFSTFADYLDAKYATGVAYPLVEVRARCVCFCVCVLVWVLRAYL